MGYSSDSSYRNSSSGHSRHVTVPMRPKKSPHRPKATHSTNVGIKTVMKKPESYTRTLTVKKKRVDEPKTGGEHSVGSRYFRIVVHPHPKKKPVINNSWVYEQAQQSLWPFSSGQQLAVAPLYVATRDQFLTDSGAGYSNIQAFQSVISLNADQKNVGSTYFGSGSPFTDRFWLKRITVQTEISNLANIPGTYTIYVYRFKRDTNSDIAIHWSSGQSQMVPYTGYSVMTFPVSPALTTGGFGSNSIQNVGCNPEGCTEVKDFCKLLHKDTFELAAGGTHRVFYNLHMNKLVKHELLQLQGLEYLAGYTIGFLLVGHNVPVHDTNVAGVGAATYGEGKLGMCTQTRYFCSTLVGKGSSKPKIEFAISNLPTQTPIANEKFANSVDAIIAEAVA